MTAAEGGSALAESGYSQSLERGLAILASFRPERPLLGVSDLARQLGLSRSTTHRYVATLAALGYLQQDPSSRKYRLGLRVLDLGFSAISSMELRTLAAPHLQDLSDEVGHTANMAVLDGSDIVYVERCRTSRHGQREIDLNLHIGSRLPAYCTSMGKALLAFMPDAERDAVIAGTNFSRRGPNTRTSRQALLKDLERVRETGIAVNDQELAYGLRSIAVPVRGAAGEPVAAINLAVHRTMVSLDDLIVRLGPALRRTADEISARLGYRGDGVPPA